MAGLLAFFNLDLWQFLMILVVAVLVGMGKAGVSGIVMLAIPILAAAVGGKESTGLMLVLFLIADVFAVKAYSKHARWQDIRPLLPSAVVGLVLGSLVGNWINDQQFKWLIAGLVLVCLVVMLIQEKQGANFKVPQGLWFVVLIGLLSGFSSMIGNAAGPIFAVYLLALGLNKNNYLGTTAWFFLIINLLKLPIQVLAWHNISWQTALLALLFLPAIFAGIRLGIWFVRILKEKTFRYMVLIMTAAAAVRLFF